MLVCVKQVPDTTEIKIDPVTNTLIRDGVPSILNTFDGYALEMAARIKDKDPSSKITVVSMGPPQAKAILQECVAIAANKGYLVSDRAFGGSDTLATSYILSEAIKTLEEKEGKFDIIFCGKQAIDGDTAQVGPEIAEHLGYPQVTYGLGAEVDGDIVKVKKEVDDGVEIIGVKMPCVITATKPDFDPRYPTIKSKMAARKAEYPVLSAADLTTIDLERAGLKGSPTKVKKTFVPQKKTGGIKIKEETAEESVNKLIDALTAAKVL
jgi:electron transfer flavoprotein beta subunit